MLELSYLPMQAIREMSNLCFALITFITSLYHHVYGEDFFIQFTKAMSCFNIIFLMLAVKVQK